MNRITRLERFFLKRIFNKMRDVELFFGKYDATNGKKEFMYGISTVMEYLALEVSEEFYEEYQEEFLKNLEKSIDNRKAKWYN